jgi:hypothetical protein
MILHFTTIRNISFKKYLSTSRKKPRLRESNPAEYHSCKLPTTNRHRPIYKAAAFHDTPLKKEKSYAKVWGRGNR